MTTTETHQLALEYLGYRFVWRGGRLADVYVPGEEVPFDCVEVGRYDWQAGRVEVPFTLASLAACAEEYMAEGEDA